MMSSTQVNYFSSRLTGIKREGLQRVLSTCADTWFCEGLEAAPGDCGRDLPSRSASTQGRRTSGQAEVAKEQKARTGTRHGMHCCTGAGPLGTEYWPDCQGLIGKENLRKPQVVFHWLLVEINFLVWLSKIYKLVSVLTLSHGR